MRVHQIRVHGTVFERLEAVAHATRHVDRLRWIQYGRVHLAERVAGTQVHPRAEHATGRNRDVLVPRLGVDATRHALLRVETDVVLHRTEIRQPQRGLLRTLPVLLEPTTIITMHRQIKHHQARDVRPHGPQILLKIHEIHLSYAFSILHKTAHRIEEPLFFNTFILQNDCSYSAKPIYFAE